MVATLYVHAILFLFQTGNPGASSWDLRSMWSQMSALPRSVVVILFVLSIYSFGVMIDRALMYSAARKQSRVFVQQVAGALKDGKLDEAIAIADSGVITMKMISSTSKMSISGTTFISAIAPPLLSPTCIPIELLLSARPVRVVRAVVPRRSSDCSAPWSAS